MIYCRRRTSAYIRRYIATVYESCGPYYLYRRFLHTVQLQSKNTLTFRTAIEIYVKFCVDLLYELELYG
jgi:hypothetical protein